MIVLDIETIPTEIDPAYATEQEAKLKEKYAKEETVAKYMAKLPDQWRWELGGSKPICIGLKSLVTEEAWAFQSPDTKLLIETALKKMEEFSKAGTPAVPKVIGFNIISFDLQVLNTQCSQLGINPRSLAPSVFPLRESNVVDMIYKPYGKARNRESLARYLHAFGLPPKTNDGSEVEELWRLDQADGGKRVSEYCLSDVRLEGELYKRLNNFILL